MFARCLHFLAKMLVSWDRQTPSHWLAAVSLFRGGGCDAVGRGELRALRLSVPLETGPAGPTNPFNPPPPCLTVFQWWEHWQRLADNWKLQSTESNYPEQDFPNILQCGVILFVSSLCPCFTNILPWSCTHIQPLLSFFFFNTPLPSLL